jgi:hypothetical protein
MICWIDRIIDRIKEVNLKKLLSGIKKVNKYLWSSLRIKLSFFLVFKDFSSKLFKKSC